VAEFEVARRFPEGTHKIEVPDAFHTVDELIAVGSYPARTREDSACAVYVVYPQAGLVEVVPQKWFTASQYEVGRQWISRVTRSDDHRFVGEAVRVGKFQLTPTGSRSPNGLRKRSTALPARRLFDEVRRYPCISDSPRRSILASSTFFRNSSTSYRSVSILRSRAC